MRDVSQSTERSTRPRTQHFNKDTSTHRSFNQERGYDSIAELLAEVVRETMSSSHRLQLQKAGRHVMASLPRA